MRYKASTDKSSLVLLSGCRQRDVDDVCNWVQQSLCHGCIPHISSPFLLGNVGDDAISRKGKDSVQLKDDTSNDALPLRAGNTPNRLYAASCSTHVIRTALAFVSATDAEHTPHFLYFVCRVWRLLIPRDRGRGAASGISRVWWSNGRAPRLSGRFTRLSCSRTW